MPLYQMDAFFKIIDRLCIVSFRLSVVGCGLWFVVCGLWFVVCPTSPLKGGTGKGYEYHCSGDKRLPRYTTFRSQ
jgi:hypothetical protein